MRARTFSRTARRSLRLVSFFSPDDDDDDDDDIIIIIITMINITFILL